MPILSTADTVLANSYDDEIPFEWRGGVNDALYQATQATHPFQIQKLKRSIIRYFVLSLALPCVALLLVSLAIFFSTGFQFYACFIVLLFLAFLIVYRIMWLVRLLKAIHNPENFYVTNSSNILIEPHREEAEIQALPPPPPTYEVAQRSPPNYELYKLSDVSLMANQSQTNFSQQNAPLYENVAQISMTSGLSTLNRNISMNNRGMQGVTHNQGESLGTVITTLNCHNNNTISSIAQPANSRLLTNQFSTQLTPPPLTYQRTN